KEDCVVKLIEKTAINGKAMPSTTSIKAGERRT
ncbi:uncharacterized protein METZ01_LOCUS120803, partial [marine metagenome]